MYSDGWLSRWGFYESRSGHQPLINHLNYIGNKYPTCIISKELSDYHFPQFKEVKMQQSCDTCANKPGTPNLVVGVCNNCRLFYDKLKSNWVEKKVPKKITFYRYIYKLDGVYEISDWMMSNWEKYSEDFYSSTTLLKTETKVVEL